MKIKDDKGDSETGINPHARTVVINYEYKGVGKRYTIIPLGMEYQSIGDHSEGCYVLNALDVKTQSPVSFAIQHIVKWDERKPLFKTPRKK